MNKYDVYIIMGAIQPKTNTSFHCIVVEADGFFIKDGCYAFFKDIPSVIPDMQGIIQKGG